MTTRMLFSCVLCAGLLLGGAAGAQTGDKASAEILFNEGRAAAQAGNYELACEKLAESQRMDPAVGTLLNLGDCQERLGRTASAWATWLEAAALARAAGQADREVHARQRADALVPRLVTLTVEVPQEHRVPGLTVSRNAVVMGPASWGSATPVDPGQYEVAAKAPGHQTWTTTLTVREGTPARLLVPRLTPEPAPGATPPTTGPAPEPAPSQPAPIERSSTGPSPLVFVAGGVGVVGLGVGTFFGLSAMSKNEDSKDECPAGYTRCSAEGVELRNEAFDAATISTIGFVAGGVGVAAAAVLWLTGSSQASEQATGVRTVSAGADGNGASIALTGAF